MKVVGMAKDSKYYSIQGDAELLFYVPRRQNFSVAANLYVRTPLSPDTLSRTLAREVHALDANLALYEVITLQETGSRSTSAQMVAVTLVGILGALALPRWDCMV